MKLTRMIFAAMHIAETVDHTRLGSDPGYREALIRQLCGEEDEPLNRIGHDNGANDALQRAA